MEYLRRLRTEKGISQQTVADYLGITRQAYSNYENGNRAPDTENLLKLAEFFGVSVDNILRGPEKVPAPTLTAKDQRDIARDLEKLKADLESADSLMFDGNPMSEEARESILAAMKLGLEAAKLKNKETYTPKKYRKE